MCKCKHPVTFRTQNFLPVQPFIETKLQKQLVLISDIKALKIPILCSAAELASNDELMVEK